MHVNGLFYKIDMPGRIISANHTNEVKRKERAGKERRDRKRKEKQQVGLPDPIILIHSAKGRSFNKVVIACLKKYQCK